MGVMLSVKDLVVNYGAINAIKGISFDVNEGEIVTLIGANGAGKTTTLHAVSRLLKPKQGEISFCGQPISSMEAHKIIQLGLTQVPEGRRVFSQLTVQQNLALGAYTRKDGADAVAADYEMVFQRLPRLKERRRQIAGTLSGGEQQMLAIGRALMSSPRMLLMDEPYGQMDIKLRFYLEDEVVRLWKETGSTVLFITHNIEEAVYLAERILILSNKPTTIKEDFKVDLPRPRDVTSPEFTKIRQYVTDQIKWW